MLPKLLPMPYRKSRRLRDLATEMFCWISRCNCFFMTRFCYSFVGAALGRGKTRMDRGLKPLLRVSIHINEFVAIKYDETEVGEGSSFRIDIGEGWVRRIVVESEKDFRKGEWGPGHFFYG